MLPWRWMGAGACAAAIAIGACGNVAHQDAAAAASGTGAGGSSESVASSSASGGSACPQTQPPQGSPCSIENESCTYGQLCGAGAVAQCKGGKWRIIYPNCPAAPCPDPPPMDGDACSHGPAQCNYNVCDSGSPNPSTLHATCGNGSWSVTSGTCPASCPPGTCGPEQLCIVMTSGISLTYGCTQNPCKGALDCSCAGEYCESDATCAVIDPTTIGCTCDGDNCS